MIASDRLEYLMYINFDVQFVSAFMCLIMQKVHHIKKNCEITAEDLKI